MRLYTFYNLIFHFAAALLMIAHIVFIVALLYSPFLEIKNLKQEIKRIKYECFFRVEEDHD